MSARDDTRPRSAYDEVGWDNLTPYARKWIDDFAAMEGVTLHHATDAETLRRYIRLYRSSW
jgi:hypothetical protein